MTNFRDRLAHAAAEGLIVVVRWAVVLIGLAVLVLAIANYLITLQNAAFNAGYQQALQQAHPATGTPAVPSPVPPLAATKK